MIHQLRKIDDTNVQVSVTLSSDDLEKAVSAAERSLARGMSIDGFRPGKIPPHVVRKHIDEKTLREEALNTAVHTSLAKVLEQEKLDVIEQESFSIKENTKDALVYETVLTLFPKVKLGTYKGIEVKKRATAVTDAETERAIENLRASRASLADINRPAQKGDQVEVDFALRVDGVPLKGGESKNHPLVIGDGKFVPGFEDQLIGVRKGEQKSFTLKVPADYYQKTIAGKELTADITMKHVQARTLPEVNDNFAKGLGRFASVDDLKRDISEGLAMDKEAKERDRIRVELLQKIAAESFVAVPAVLVNRQLDSMIQGLGEELREQGMELALYCAHIKKTQDELRAEWRPKAETQVKLLFVAHAIAKAENITVREEEVEKALVARLQRSMRENQQGTADKNSIHAALLNEKVFQFLEKHSTMVQA